LDWKQSLHPTPFLDCAYAKFFWHAIHLVFGLAPPKDVDDLFNHWLNRRAINQNFIYRHIGYVLGYLALSK
jgi:hypothetical protein